MNRITNLDQLEGVTGGAKKTVANQPKIPVECPKCHNVFGADVSGSYVKCPKCHYIMEIKG